MKKELIYNETDGVSIVINDKYQIYMSDWAVYRLNSEGDIPQYIFKLIKKFKKRIDYYHIINLSELIK